MSPFRYVYGIAASERRRARRDRRHLAASTRAPVGCVVEGMLLAAASDVDDEEFNEAALNAHLRDLDWLAARARSTRP